MLNMSHRSARITAFGLVFAASLTAVHAQTQPANTPQATAPSDTLVLDTVSVTGTNIKRMDQEKVLPVTVINREAMDARNALTPVEMLTSLPLVTGVPQNEATNGGAGVRGDGATINLRGIGAGSTLILLDGRRLAPHPITAGDNGQNAFAPNVNQLPTQGIARIDVLRDGASSVYGSDAVAGVINYIMREDYRGNELRLRFGVPEQAGGQNAQATLTHGSEFAGGKGSVLVTLDYLYREAIYLRDRDFSATARNYLRAPAPFNTAGSAFDGTSATGYYESFRIGSATTANYFRPLSGAGSTPGFTTAAISRTTTPEYYLDINQYQMGSPRTTRVNAFTKLKYDLTPQITAFGDVSLYHAKSHLVRQPLALNAPSADQLKVMSVDNPYNPYGSAFYAVDGDGVTKLKGTPQSITLLTGTLKDAMPEHVQVTSGVYRVLAGVRGKIFDTWSWESAALYTRAASTDLSRNGVRESLFAAALARTDAGAYNPFGYTFKIANGAVVADQAYTNPQSTMATFVKEWRHEGFSSIGSIDLRASGELFTLWSGPLSLAFGGEGRQERFVDYRMPYAGLNPSGSGLNADDNDFVTASPKPDSHGDRKVASAYAETVIPLVGERNNVPLVRRFEITGSGRFEHYSDFGNTTKPKVGLNWKPYSGAMLRASFNEGFSAPNLPTLYAPTQYTVDSQPGTVDTYRNPVTNEGAYVQRGYTTGNPKLQPATSIGKSAGIVFEVPKVKGLTLTADYWQIEQQNVINTLSTSQILEDDRSRLVAYTQSQLAAGVPIGSIDVGSGTANYKGSPYVTRNAPTAADVATFAAYNAGKATSQQMAVAGQIFSRNVAFQNLAKGYVAGWDLGLNYVLPRLPIGKFTFSTDWTYLNRSYFTKNVPNSAPITQERLNVNGTTRWRGNGVLAWSKGNWNASLSAYYVGKYSDSGAAISTTPAATYAALGSPRYISKTFDSGGYVYRWVVNDTLTFNAAVGYKIASDSRWLKNTSVRVGVINATNKAPPLESGNFGFSSSVYLNLLAGRTWTLDVTRQF